MIPKDKYVEDSLEARLLVTDCLVVALLFCHSPVVSGQPVEDTPCKLCQVGGG